MADRSSFAGIVSIPAGARARVLGWLCALVLMFTGVRPCGAGWENYAQAAGPLVAVLCVLLAERLARRSAPVMFELEEDTISWGSKSLRRTDVSAWAEVRHQGQVVVVLTTLLDETWWLILDEGPGAAAMRAWLSRANDQGQLRFEETSMTPRAIGIAAVAPLVLAGGIYFFGALRGIHEVLFFGMIALLLTSFGCCFMILGAALRRGALMFDRATILSPGPSLLDRVRIGGGERRRVLLKVDGVLRTVRLARVLDRAARERLGLDEAGVCLRVLQSRIEAVQSTRSGVFR
jgi:hypothetical protein